MKYDFGAIEQRWQAYWDEHRTFAAPNPGDEGFDPDKPKYYVLAMFPYPSGAGAHMGHALNYSSTDIVARYKRMTGHNVLHPIGFDAFGLPAEQYAVERGIHPSITTEQNIRNLTSHFRRLGLCFDWDRSLSTTDPRYYRWTQWIFLQMVHCWFDPAAGGARPIDELEQKLSSEQLYVGPDGELVTAPAEGLDAIGGTPIGVRKWHELSPEDQRQILDNHRLAYIDDVEVNWCPALGTVLANEEITNEGLSDSGNHPVFKRPLRQWMLRITAFADRLLQDLDLVDWPEPIKIMQRNWIGRSEGATVDFALVSRDDVISVFTTRPDTLFGATYMVLAPEHPIVDQVTVPECRDAVRKYQHDSQCRSDIDRMAEAGTKTGVFTGAYAINPLNDENIPIWIADYVLMGYGTGAIMAVPAHDQRDLEFARCFGLPIRAVVLADDSWLAAHEVTAESYCADPSVAGDAFVGNGTSMASANEYVSLDDLPTAEAKSRISEWLDAQGIGRPRVQYKLRDWLFSRQRYWGEPFPILHGPDGQVVALDESDLPVELPQMEQFKPHATDDPSAQVQTPLSRAPDDWVRVDRGGVTYTRELNTMPQWAGSCWYYLRFLDPDNGERFVRQEVEQYWMSGEDSERPNAAGGVDLYVGGVEHAVLHLLYARFWHKVLYDLGHVSSPEPFGRLYNQGYIQAHAYRNQRGMYVPATEIEQKDGEFFHEGQPVTREFGKMGKSLKNSVAPDEICDQYGADTLRLFLMYLGPLDQSKLWNPRDIVGVHRFLQRLWRNMVDDQTGRMLVSHEPASLPLQRLQHRTIKRVTDGLERLSINTAIAALIELNNELMPLESIPRETAETMILLLSPMAPHICEQLWHMLGHERTLAYEDWPLVDEALLIEKRIEYPVQVAGKLRSRVVVPADAATSDIESAALADPKVQSAIEGKTVEKVIVVKDKMVNVVAR